MAQVQRIQVESKKDIQYLMNEFMNYSLSSYSNLLNSSSTTADSNTTNCNVNRVSEEDKKKLEKWIQSVFLMAGDSIEINGTSFLESFNQLKEYELIDENIRKRADELQHQVQNRLVHLTEIRKKLPKIINENELKKIQKKNKISEDGIIKIRDSEAIITKEFAGENNQNTRETKDNKENSGFNVDENVYNKICATKLRLQKILPQIELKINQIQSVLDDLKITGNSKIKRRRKSSIAAIIESTPRKAGHEILSRIQSNL